MKVYAQMNREGREQAAYGYNQAVDALDQPFGLDGVWNLTKGVGNMAFGGVNYLSSPASAAYRTIVGNPFIPREYSEFVASILTPFAGKRLPGRPSSVTGRPPVQEPVHHEAIDGGFSPPPNEVATPILGRSWKQEVRCEVSMEKRNKRYSYQERSQWQSQIQKSLQEYDKARGLYSPGGLYEPSLRALREVCGWRTALRTVVKREIPALRKRIWLFWCHDVLRRPPNRWY